MTRLNNELTLRKATINVGAPYMGAMTTGVAVDGAGKVWACNYYDGKLNRIQIQLILQFKHQEWTELVWVIIIATVI